MELRLLISGPMDRKIILNDSGKPNAITSFSKCGRGRLKSSVRVIRAEQTAGSHSWL